VIFSSRFAPSLVLNWLPGTDVLQPIQRVCKYPLFFSELLKQTTIADCANSHMEIKSSLLRLREATAEINTATDDARIRNILEKTWLLQDRLVFPNQVCLPVVLHPRELTSERSETRRCLQKSHPVIRTHSAVWSASCLLADQRLDQRAIHDCSPIQRLALPRFCK
jgi:hypothetical protein